MNSDQDMVKLVKETIELEDKLDADQKFKNNLAALTIVLCDKLVVKVDSRGRITIPKEARKKADIESGDILFLHRQLILPEDLQ